MAVCAEGDGEVVWMSWGKQVTVREGGCIAWVWVGGLCDRGL